MSARLFLHVATKCVTEGGKKPKSNGHLKTHTCDENKKYLHDSLTILLCSVELQRYLLENVAGGKKTAGFFKLRLFPHSSSPKHTPYDNEKKVGWGEELNHGKDMCCSLISLRTPEEDL